MLRVWTRDLSGATFVLGPAFYLRYLDGNTCYPSCSDLPSDLPDAPMRRGITDGCVYSLDTRRESTRRSRSTGLSPNSGCTTTASV